MREAGPTEGPGVLRFEAVAPFWSERLLDRIARRLSASPAGRGVLLEWRTGRRAPLIGVPGAAERSMVLASASGLPGRWIAGDAAGGLPRHGALLLGALDSVPESTAHPAPPEGRARPSRSPLEGDPTPIRGLWSVQWHFHSVGRPGTLEGSLRFGVAGAPSKLDALQGQWVARLSEPLAELGYPSRYRAVRTWGRNRREWIDGRLRSFRSQPSFRLSAEEVVRVVPRPPVRPFPGPNGPNAHVVLLGASGGGKTALVAEWGSAAIAAGRPVVAFDLHGDLGPMIVSRLPEADRRRVVAVDAAWDRPGVPGVDVLAARDERGTAHIVAALRRSSDDRGELFWGFRLERVFDAFVRLVVEEQGSLIDLYDLLTEERRREAARLATRSEPLARFLDELRGILRRNPEFLWPAAARVSKIAHAPRLAALVAPSEAALDVDPLLEEGRSLIFRVPVGTLGPEGASLAATLIAARIYLGRTARSPSTGRPVLMLFDEAQTISPTLLAEILSEGRKFGVAAVVATQYPGRLVGPLRDAAAGSVTSHLGLQTPRAGAGMVAPWVGLGIPEAERSLSRLSPGTAVLCVTGEEGPRLLNPGTIPLPVDGSAWRRRVEATIAEFGSADGAAVAPDPLDGLPGRLLLSLRGIELAGRAADVAGAWAEWNDAESPTPPREELEAALGSAHRRGWVAPVAEGGWSVTVAGRAYLGEIPQTGAVRESDAHRALLWRAFRIFALRGERIEILRQGRFDLRLPDGRLRLMGREAARATPARLADLLARRRESWAWRAFGGRDVHIEAEVSGAERRERIVRDLEKARGASSHCLFLVGTPAHARRVRSVLADRGISRQEATVWLLKPTVAEPVVAEKAPEGRAMPRPGVLWCGCEPSLPSISPSATPSLSS